MRWTKARRAEKAAQMRKYHASRRLATARDDTPPAPARHRAAKHGYAEPLASPAFKLYSAQAIVAVTEHNGASETLTVEATQANTYQEVFAWLADLAALGTATDIRIARNVQG